LRLIIGAGPLGKPFFVRPEWALVKGEKTFLNAVNSRGIWEQI
jgi:hypothetical protein